MVECRHGGEGNPSIRCGFDDFGNFMEDNWNCPLLNKLKELTGAEDFHYGVRFYDEDNWTGIIFIPYLFEYELEFPPHPLRGSLVILTWFGNRHNIASFEIIYRQGPFWTSRKGTEQDAYDILNLFGIPTIC